MFIRLKNISKNFGNTLAVKGVNLDIQPDEVLGLVGESGSGKSTLARLILKLIEPSSGEITYNNDVSNIHRKLQIVFQDPQTSLNPRIRIGEAIGEPIRIQRIRMKDKNEEKVRVKDLLELVKLPAEFASRYPHELSGGERQRVGIARALASQPRFLILDEPVSSLDVLIQVEILKLLKELKEKLRLTYLFIAHDLLVVGFMSERIAVMQDGKIVEIGDKKQILNNPANPYTKALIESSLLTF